MGWGVYTPTLKIQQSTQDIPGHIASFFPRMAIADFPAWYTLFMAAQSEGGLRDLNLILGQLLGFSCWTDMGLVHKDNNYIAEHSLSEFPYNGL